MQSDAKSSAELLDLGPGDELCRVITHIPGPRSQAMAERLARAESPDATCFGEDFPVFWNAARGANIWDADGNRYIDLNAGFGAAAIGHSHPRVIEAIRGQSERLIHAMGDVHPNELKLKLAEALASRMPGSGKIGAWKAVFGLSGADAVEAAIKTVAIATGKPGLITFEGGYHGMTLGTLAATPWPKFHEGIDQSTATPATLLPYPDRSNAADVVQAVRKAFIGAEHTARPIGGVIIEPIQGRGGVRVPPHGFLAQLRAMTSELGMLLIHDEIYTGLGRTGRWLASQHEPGSEPDLITLGKALGGGMPISVCMGRGSVIDHWGKSTGEARHTSTFSGHPIGCAAALAVLDAIDSEELVEQAERKGKFFKQALKDKLSGIAGVAEVRGRGLMLGIELIEPDSTNPDAARAWSVVVESLARGIILLVSGMQGNVLSLTPPISITERQMEFGADVIAEALRGTEHRTP